MDASESPIPFKLLLQNGQATPERLFYIYRDFRGRGLKTFLQENPSRNSQFSEISATFELVEPAVTLRVQYHPAHFYSQTAWSKLSGHTRLMWLDISTIALTLRLWLAPM
jgi:hypothetical protein